MKKTTIALLAVIIIIVGAVLYIVLQPSEGNFGSITTGQEYSSTTTPERSGGWEDQRIDGAFGNSRNWGSLGSVVVTKAGDIDYFLLDATTSLALSDVATSSVLIAYIPAGLVAGTYIFDVEFTDGLFLDVMNGNTGSSTITIRQ